MKIGFYDSGLGGLTIFREAINKIKAEYIYLGDNKNAPYGVKDKNEVKKYIFENAKYLINQGCKIIVIACNTATSLAIKELREKYKEICFIGTEPAVKKAVDANCAKRILVCGTSITIKEEKLNNLINNLHANDKVDLIPLDKLVKFAEGEKIDLKNDNCNEEVLNYLYESLKSYNIRDYSYVVLGCTHFPLFKKEFKEVFGKDTNIIDGSIGVINNLINKIKLLKYENENILHYTLVLTKEEESFIDKFKLITAIDDFEVKYKK